jgi:hypothetical protein
LYLVSRTRASLPPSPHKPARYSPSTPTPLFYHRLRLRRDLKPRCNLLSQSILPFFRSSYQMASTSSMKPPPSSETHSPLTAMRKDCQMSTHFHLPTASAVGGTSQKHTSCADNADGADSGAEVTGDHHDWQATAAIALAPVQLETGQDRLYAEWDMRT